MKKKPPMPELRPIQNEDELDASIEAVNWLLEQDLDEEGRNYLDRISDFIYNYEEKYYLM